jgi:hypothetical protein
VGGGDLPACEVLFWLARLLKPKKKSPKFEGPPNPDGFRISRRGLPVSGFPDELLGKSCLFREEFPQRVFARVNVVMSSVLAWILVMVVSQLWCRNHDVIALTTLLVCDRTHDPRIFIAASSIVFWCFRELELKTNLADLCTDQCWYANVVSCSGSLRRQRGA